MSDAVLLEVRDGVAHLTLNRPTDANSFDLPTAQAVTEAVERIEADDDATVVVLTGNGPRFCAGGDVASFAAADDPQAYLRELADVLDGAMQRLAALPKPVVAGVQGAVAGAGLSVMLAADLVVAERSTKFVTAYAGIGLTPDIGLSYLLPRAVGQVRAMELLLNGRVLDGDTALDWGLVSEVVDAGAADRARSLGQKLADSVPGAYGQARRLVRSGWESTRAEVGQDEAATIAARVGTDEAQARIQKFLAKR
ncbi:enoyl-CoA hydratase [Aeromicrobium sp. Root495]|uniref:enoyl-CoA hydratase/isomerase family protein n=1 Tax=Aeromicrobium sp. Root495 TaxID=1736550 RepID=UPI0006FA206B|nr:enoyl-CoA hydratase/isomerase family protein [Aeromicrobium sp. Root495]KQY58482.1 enoyl-CoA hydratase [Aeromicrobium sp. Root495]